MVFRSTFLSVSVLQWPRFMAHATARRMAEVADELFVVYTISALALNLYPALLANLRNSRFADLSQLQDRDVCYECVCDYNRAP